MPDEQELNKAIQDGDLKKSYTPPPPPPIVKPTIQPPNVPKPQDKPPKK